MTLAARISQADVERATKAVRAAGYERARIVLDLAKQKIEIIIGESVQDEPAPDTWSDDDV
ncbi:MULTISPECIES: hypothetical protein [unclassified Blastomonas]|uniref:hypothetical protein n=1 Tax=unclassified Blastomonas TaxID=2626550 RepID=UPI000826D5BC|nr:MULTISPECIES: hypothetical protein [unclassified Blastomonas]